MWDAFLFMQYSIQLFPMAVCCIVILLFLGEFQEKLETATRKILSYSNKILRCLSRWTKQIKVSRIQSCILFLLFWKTTGSLLLVFVCYLIIIITGGLLPLVLTTSCHLHFLSLSLSLSLYFSLPVPVQL